MSRLGDIAIGVIIGVGGLIGAALAWDKYESPENSNTSNSDDVKDKEVNVDAENEGKKDSEPEEKKYSAEDDIENSTDDSTENCTANSANTQTEQDINYNEPLIPN